ncbi:acetyltransferase [Anaerolinea thermolimosa]|uniref:GNAT family N-acetyltransferase n=1 Tax=Anaerolinea thermolimosa TaxID=229919 RepID=UPI0007850402|nr:GNAT family N-acetyltransferase [Anaerolinea thermolimosa]GAP07794.1 acetyltransferase [Anaerolinea thermolimosa]
MSFKIEPADTPSRPEVHPLPPHLLHQAAQVLADAFFDDPLMVHYLPDPQKRRALLPGVLGVYTRIAIRQGLALTTPGLEGVALWMPPGKTDSSLWDYFLASLGMLDLRFVFMAWRRLREIEPFVERLHHECLPQPHWYLAVLGVRPGAQKQGTGTRLIAAGLERADRDALPSYLETMSEENVAFYQKRGFQVVRRVTLPGTMLPLWAMVRPAHPPSPTEREPDHAG